MSFQFFKKIRTVIVLFTFFSQTITVSAASDHPGLKLGSFTENEAKRMTAFSYSDELFAQACFLAQDLAKGYQGYTLETTPIDINLRDIPGVKAKNAYNVDLILDAQPGDINNETRGALGCRFCNHTTKLLYNDGVVKVIKKPGSRPGTDVLIMPLNHIRQTNVLNKENRDDVALLVRIAQVAREMSAFLANDKLYTLMTNNGTKQDIPHLHVHFKSCGTLDEEKFEQAFMDRRPSESDENLPMQ